MGIDISVETRTRSDLPGAAGTDDSTSSVRQRYSEPRAAMNDRRQNPMGTRPIRAESTSMQMTIAAVLIAIGIIGALVLGRTSMLP